MTLADLRESAAVGCRLCHTFVEAFLARNYRSRQIDVNQWSEKLDDRCSGYAFQISLDWVTASGIPTQQSPVGQNLVRAADKIVFYRHQASDFEMDDDDELARGISGLAGVNALLTSQLELSMLDDTTTAAHRPIMPDVDWEIPRKWILSCSRDHQACRGRGIECLPFRVLDVTYIDNLRLVESSNERAGYVTLSHRWGSNSPRITTKATLDGNLKGIAMTSLPRMFQDAVTATRTLGYQYLWIDSICIVQDDPGDWRQQCARMHEIYWHAAVCIACPGSANASDGFLHPRASRPGATTIPYYTTADRIGECQLRIISFATETERAADDLGRRKPHSKHDHLRGRAWCMQERLMPSRVLYFGTDQMAFECNTMYQYEDYRLPFSNDGYEDNLQKDVLTQAYSSGGFSVWHSIVEHYTKCSLSRAEDILPALSGVASVFCSRLTNSRYLAGIWQADLPDGLLWFRVWDSDWWWEEPSSRPEDLPRPMISADSILPSWSWASCRYPISYDNMRHYRKTTHESGHTIDDCEILDMTTKLVGEDPHGEVSGGNLHLRGMLKRCFFRYRECRTFILEAIHDEDGNILATNDFALASSYTDPKDPGHMMASPPEVLVLSMQFRLDEHELSLSPSVQAKHNDELDEVWCFLVSASAVLVLRPSEDRPKCFVRVGLLKQQWDPSLDVLFTTADKQDVHIV
ncbi:hypothetical protein LTR86_000119 [Recurvomyces mirabilis]|nr:hypothetical protein LTR86_000119 [Recurvomyces mirabilis]